MLELNEVSKRYETVGDGEEEYILSGIDHQDPQTKKETENNQVS